METLKQLIIAESDYRMADETMEKFLGFMAELRLKDKEPLIPYGKFTNNIYVLKEGTIRLAYFDGPKERTFAFAAPGTLLIPFHSYYMNRPSFFQYESCGQSVVMEVPKAKFDELLRQSNDFSQWVLNVLMVQMYSLEMKLAVMNGTPKERFEALAKDRPHILQKVSNRVIASYIGVDEAYLSRLKKRIL
jgi:CRP-like cAMP-binding protein